MTENITIEGAVKRPSKLELKARLLWAKVTETGKNIVEWVDTHRETAALIGGAAVAGANILHKHKKQETEDRKQTTYYDPHTGMHWDLRRKPTNYDRIQLENRQRAGESTHDILRDLRLI